MSASAQEREAFRHWFSDAVREAAYKAEGLAAFAYPMGEGGKLPPMLTGDYKRGDPAFSADKIISVSINMKQDAIDVTTLGGAVRRYAGRPPEITMDIEAYYDKRFFDALQEGEEIEIDVAALLKKKKKELGEWKDARWRMQRLDMRMDVGKPVTCTMTLYKTR